MTKFDFLVACKYSDRKYIEGVSNSLMSCETPIPSLKEINEFKEQEAQRISEQNDDAKISIIVLNIMPVRIEKI